MIKKNRKEDRENREQMYKYQNQGYYRNMGDRK